MKGTNQYMNTKIVLSHFWIILDDVSTVFQLLIFLRSEIIKEQNNSSMNIILNFQNKRTQH